MVICTVGHTGHITICYFTREYIIGVFKTHGISVLLQKTKSIGLVILRLNMQ